MTEAPLNLIMNRIEKMHLAPRTEESLIKITKALYEEMLEKKMGYAISRNNRVSIALFLACDGHACIALPKVKTVCASGSYLKHVYEARKVLGIPHGTAHEKLDSLYKAAEIEDEAVKEKGHYYVYLFDKCPGAFFPTNVATASLFAANIINSKPQYVTLGMLCFLTGCTEVSITNLLKKLIKEVKRMKEETGVDSLITKEELDLVHLINKEMLGGLTLPEEERKAFLIKEFKSGR